MEATKTPISTGVGTCVAADLYRQSMAAIGRTSHPLDPGDKQYVITITTTDAEGRYPGTVTGLSLRPLIEGERHDVYGDEGTPLRVMLVSGGQVWGPAYEVPAGRIVKAIES